MAIVNALISLDEAKLSIWNGVSAPESVDADLVSYISAATPVIENILRRPAAGRNELRRFDGGTRSLLLPWPFNSATVSVAGVPYTAFTADPSAGLLHAAGVFPPGRQNVEVTAAVGWTAETMPQNIKLAARELVRVWWQQTRQGNRPRFGAVDDEPIAGDDAGIPKRVYQLLKPGRVILGFA